MRNFSSFRTLVLIGLMSFISALLIGCGGVAKNPSTPQFQGKDDGTQGETAPGGTGGEVGAPEIRDTATYEELYATGMESIEGGFLKNAADAFEKAIEKDREKPDVVLAYAITKLAGSPEEMSVLMTPGIDYFYYNTPLIGRWEFLPAPLCEQDSYLLRLVSLGTLYSSVNKTQPAAPALPPGTPSIGGEGAAGLPGGEKGKDGGMIKGGDGEGRIGQSMGMGRGLMQGVAGLAGDGSGDKIRYEGKDTKKKVEYLTFKKDLMPTLIQDYQGLARTYSGGYLNRNAANTSINKLSTLVNDLVEKLEYTKDKINEDTLALELPFKLDKSDGVYQIYFTNYDYMVILGYLKLIQGELKYRSAYNSTVGTDNLYKLPVDANTDSILSPAEYYPAAPYGEIIEKGDEITTEAFADISAALSILTLGFDQMYTDDKLADFSGNMLVPINIDAFLLDLIAEHRDNFSDMQVLLTAGKGSRIFKSPFGDIKADVDVTKLTGKNAPKSVMALLPELNASDFEAIISANNTLFPDPTWNGFFPMEMDDFDVFRTRGDITGSITYQGVGIKDVSIKTSGGKSATTDDKGKFTIKDIDINELVGLTVSVSSKEIVNPVSAQIHSHWIAVDLQTITGEAPISKPSEGLEEGPAMPSGTTGGLQSGAAGGGETSRIDEIKGKSEEEKKAGEG